MLFYFYNYVVHSALLSSNNNNDNDGVDGNQWLWLYIISRRYFFIPPCFFGVFFLISNLIVGVEGFEL